MPRQLSPYELTHLRRFGKSKVSIADYGQMPVEYITGKVEFDNHVFEINRQVLIPRIESEKLVELAVNQVPKIDRQQLKVADIGCGCGAVGLSLWHRLTTANHEVELYLSDVSTAALRTTRGNAAQLMGSSSAAHLLQSDLLQTYPTDIKIDVMVANLPYIPSPRIQALASSVKDYEPHLALDGGQDGLQLIRPLVSQASKHLANDGVLILEIDSSHDEQFLTQQLDLECWQLELVRDQFHKNRFAVLKPLITTV